MTWVSGIWSAVVVQTFAIMHNDHVDVRWFLIHLCWCNNALMVLFRLYDYHSWCQHMLSLSWICVSTVVSCLEIALSSTAAIAMAYSGDTAMAMTVTCNGDYDHTAVTIAMTVTNCFETDENQPWPWPCPNHCLRVLKGSQAFWLSGHGHVKSPSVCPKGGSLLMTLSKSPSALHFVIETRTCCKKAI